MHPRATTLDTQTLARAVSYLANLDMDLGEVIRRHGPPPLWPRPHGFATLIRIILEQQVSLASGAAIYGRLENHVGEVTAESIRRTGESGLRTLGITRQKASYCVAVAEKLMTGALDFGRVSHADDDSAREELLRVKGIGPWTADCYLLMALRRPDVWPAGDVALLTAIQRLRRLPRRPTADEAAEIALGWTPWRAVAARILWHGYLKGSLKNPSRLSPPD